MHSHGGLREGSGRPKGQPNKISGEIKELLAPVGVRAVRRLEKLIEESSDNRLVFDACELVLNYVCGRPKALVDIDIESKRQITPEQLEQLELSDEQLRRLAGI